MNKFMQEAIKEARSGINSGHGGPFGAVIVRDGEIVGRGHNKVVLNNDPTCHGEIDAIRNACQKLNTFDLSGCELYTTSYPCPMCMSALLWANIKKFYYGCDIYDAERIGFRDNLFYSMSEEEKKNYSFEVDKKECLELFNEYENIKDKTRY